MKKFDVTPTDLRKFSIQISIVLFVLGIILFLRHRESYILFYLAGILFLLGLFTPNLIKPIYFIYMKLTLILEWTTTRLTLLTIFYLVFTPFGLVIRLFRIDFLDRKIEKKKESYWKEKIKQPLDQLRYERQF